MTAAEYYALPEGPPYAQLIEGELLMSPSPTFFHQRIIIKLIVSLESFVAAHRLGKVCVAPSDVQFDEENVFQPDVFFVSNERLHLADDHGIKGAPDLVIEVISGTGRIDLGPKKNVYARGGVIEYWTVRPKTKLVEIWRLSVSTTEPAVQYGVTDMLVTDLLPGWQMPVAAVFAG